MPDQEMAAPTQGHAVIRPLGWVGSVLAFGVPALVLALATWLVIPALVQAGLRPMIAWFFAGGLLVFGPMLVASLVGARRRIWCAFDDYGSLWAGLRLRPMDREDWRLAGLVFLAMAASTAALTFLGQRFLPGFTPGPPFMRVEPLGAGEWWVLLAWLPFWFLNIAGEELFWRGCLLPRQELFFGRRAWLLHGALWGVFHASFGWGLILVVAPSLFLIPWAVQRRGNTWVGLILHALLNGPAFILISLGVLRL